MHGSPKTTINTSLPSLILSQQPASNLSLKNSLKTLSLSQKLSLKNPLLLQPKELRDHSKVTAQPRPEPPPSKPPPSASHCFRSTRCCVYCQCCSCRCCCRCQRCEAAWWSSSTQGGEGE